MASDSTAVFELTVPSRMEELFAVKKLVEEATTAFDLDEEIAHWIELTVSESAINAILHGNRQDPRKYVYLRIGSNGRTIEVIVEDQGSGFDLADIPDPTADANLMKPGGRGILIIRSFMDEVELTCKEGGGSRLRMVKRLG
jgi:serine/threonine-protein kinase RsbW